MKELLNLKVEISNLDLKENTISNLLTSANKVQEEIERLNNIIDKANNILKDTNVDMPETLLIETIDYARHILNGEYEER
jgi:peptidoglycan hydrolase CwlO-like protein